MKQKKLSWDEYFLNIVDVVATRATCNRGKSGCVIVLEHRILSTGYVGAPSGFAECDEVGHLLRNVTYEDGEMKQHCVRTLHAEQNAIIYAARYGVSIAGATLYSTLVPCYSCAMMISASGIKRVVSKYPYQAGKDTIRIFKESKIELIILNQDELQY